LGLLIRAPAAAFWKRFKPVDGQNQPLDQRIGIFDGVSCNVVLDVFEIGDGGFGPFERVISW
jgi:hypothetical protein